MTDAQKYIERWHSAGLLTHEQVTRIREYEDQDVSPGRARWQVVLAITFGSLLVAAGILLFVASNWDTMGTPLRFFTVIAGLLLLHGLGVYYAPSFPRMATALHAIGTVCLGGAIALTGQIFNINEHWPAAILMWAIGATAGWYLLRDSFHEAFTWLLLPAWLLCEWGDRASGYHGAMAYGGRTLAVLGAVYLAGFLRSKSPTRVVLMIAGTLLLLGNFVMLPNAWSTYGPVSLIPISLRIYSFALMLAFATAGIWKSKSTAIPVVLTWGIAMLLPYCVQRGGTRYVFEQPSLMAYILIAAEAAFFAWWGVRQTSRALINLGIAGFAAAVLYFYFSSLMDKLGRSLGLIAMGVLFLAGGWFLEKFRRRLVHSIATEQEGA